MVLTNIGLLFDFFCLLKELDFFKLFNFTFIFIFIIKQYSMLIFQKVLKNQWVSQNKVTREPIVSYKVCTFFEKYGYILKLVFIFFENHGHILMIFHH